MVTGRTYLRADHQTEGLGFLLAVGSRLPIISHSTGPSVGQFSRPWLHQSQQGSVREQDGHYTHITRSSFLFSIAQRTSRVLYREVITQGHEHQTVRIIGGHLRVYLPQPTRLNDSLFMCLSPPIIGELFAGRRVSWSYSSRDRDQRNAWHTVGTVHT